MKRLLSRIIEIEIATLEMLYDLRAHLYSEEDDLEETHANFLESCKRSRKLVDELVKDLKH